MIILMSERKTLKFMKFIRAFLRKNLMTKNKLLIFFTDIIGQESAKCIFGRLTWAG